MVSTDSLGHTQVPTGYTYAIGDIHGHYAELLILLERLDFRPELDKLVVLGDLTNRGPESLKVLRYLYSIRSSVQAVLGNHDLMTIAGYYGAADKNAAAEQISGDLQAEQLIYWLATLPYLYQTSTVISSSNPPKPYHWIASHAGIPPQWNMATALHCQTLTMTAMQANPLQFCQAMLTRSEAAYSWEKCQTSHDPDDILRYTVNALTRMRTCTDNGDISTKQPHDESLDENYKNWFEFPLVSIKEQENTNILFGHYAALEGQTGQPAIRCLETGVSWQRTLTALCLETLDTTSVPALEPCSL